MPPMEDEPVDVPPIEVELEPERAPAFAAIVRLRGEYDMATAPKVKVRKCSPRSGEIFCSTLALQTWRGFEVHHFGDSGPGLTLRWG
jgi:hypothetical protein